MSAPRAVWEVARRELVERSRSRVMRISVALMLILSIGGAIAAARLSAKTPTDNIGLVGARSVTLAPSIRLQAKAQGRAVRFRSVASTAAAAREVHDGAIAVAIVDGRRLIVNSSPSQAAVRVAQTAIAAQATLDRLRSAGLSEAQALAALAPPVLPVEVLKPNTHKIERNRDLLAVGLIALLTVLLFYGQAVAQGVTEEKSTRVVELLLTTLSPRRLLAGKVLGIGLLGLAQLTLAGGAALVAGRLAGAAGLPSAAPETVALVLLWFVLGYAFYSVAFAAAGALVSRQEDLATAMTPITVLLIAAFYLALIVSNGNPDGTVAQIAAFVPPLSPMVVPARMVLGDMTAIGLVIAIAIDLLATAGLIMLAARIYERAILRIGAPVKLGRLLTHRSHRMQPTDAKGAHTMRNASTKKANLSTAESRLTPLADVGLRIASVVFILAGAVIGFSHPVAIVLVAVGLVVLIIEQSLKNWPRRPAH
jgi:ABC-2 type transport system permease protein